MRRWVAPVLLTAALLALVWPAFGQAGRFDLEFEEAAVEENVGFITVIVFRTNGAAGDVSVRARTVAGSASAGTDFLPIDQVLTFGSGISANSIVISVVDDAVFEDEESFTLELHSPTGGAVIGGTGLLHVTILRSDAVPGVIGISDASYSVGESSGTVSVRVARVGGVDGGVSVDFSTFNGQALNGIDYLGVSGTLSWASGDSSLRLVPVTLVDDALYEQAEEFQLILSNPVNTTMALDTVKITIQLSDQVAGSVAFVLNETVVAENVGTTFLEVARTGGKDGAVSVNVTITPVSALVGPDVVLVTRQLLWDEQDALPKSVAIAIVNDAVFEPTEQFRVSLTAPAGGVTIGALASIPVNLLDDDQEPGHVAFARRNYSTVEEAGTLVVSLTRTGGVDGDVSVVVTAAALEALVGVDFGAVSQVVSFANGEAGPKTVVLAILDDAVYEQDERYTLALSDAKGGVTIDTVNTIVTILASDQQAGTISFVQTYVEVSESIGALLIEMTRESLFSDGAVSATYTSRSGVAIGASDSSGDYRTVSGTAVWADRENGTRRIFVIIVDDTFYEENEAFTVVITAVAGGATVLADTVTVVIERNDENFGMVAFAPDGASCAACAVAVPETVGRFALALNRYEGFNEPVSAQVRLVGLTAQVLEDFVAGDVVLEWLNGQLGARTLFVTIVNDTLFEANETLLVQVTSLSNAKVRLGAYSNVTVTILGPNDQAPGSIGFAPIAVNVNEETGYVDLTLVRLFGADGAVSVSWFTVDGTANMTTDYTVAGGTVVWASGDASAKTVRVNITDDAVYERAETFFARLITPTGGASLLPGSTAATVTIATSDQRAGNVTFARDTSRVAETAGTLAVTLFRLGSTDGDVSVDVTTSDESALAGVDFSVAATTTVSWPSGDATARTVTLSLIDDALFEMDETLLLLMGNLRGGVVAGQHTMHRVTIAGPNDYNAGVLEFSPAAYSVVEESGRATLRVVRTGGSDGDVTARVTSADASAIAGLHYVAINETIFMADGVSEALFSVTILDDMTFALANVFTVSLSHPTGLAEITTEPSHTASVVIDDEADRRPGVLAFACGAYSVREDAGEIAVSVVRVGGTDGALDIVVELVEGSALVAREAAADGTLSTLTVGGAPADYRNPALARRTLNWTDGDSATKVVLIPLVVDELLEPIETFTVRLVSVATATATTSARATGENTNSSLVYIEASEGNSAALLARTVLEDKRDAWRWVGPLMVALAVFFCCLALLIALLCWLYHRRASPVVVDRHALVPETKARPPTEKLFIRAQTATYTAESPPARTRAAPQPRRSDDDYAEPEPYGYAGPYGAEPSPTGYAERRDADEGDKRAPKARRGGSDPDARRNERRAGDRETDHGYAPERQGRAAEWSDDLGYYSDEFEPARPGTAPVQGPTAADLSGSLSPSPSPAPYAAARK